MQIKLISHSFEQGLIFKEWYKVLEMASFKQTPNPTSLSMDFDS